MQYIIIIFLMIEVIYTLQILASLLVYKLHMSRLKTFTVEYKNSIYFKIFFVLFVLQLLLAVIFKISIVSILNGLLAIFAFIFLKKYFRNTVMSSDDYIYNGVALLRKSNIDEVFIEKGRNLEKKYNVRYIGLEKYLFGNYMVFKTNKLNYILVKNYDAEYLKTLERLLKRKII